MRRLSLGVVLLLAACAQRNPDRDLVPLRDGWRYTLTSPGAGPPDEHAGWAEETRPRPDRDLWMRVRLPSQLAPRAHLVFRTYTGRVDVLTGAQPIYRFENPVTRGHLTTHDVPLPPSAAGDWLLIRFPAGESGPFIGGEPVIAQASAVPAAIVEVTASPLRAHVGHVAVGAVLVVIGLGCIAVSRLRVRGNAAALLWFGAFASLYGLRLILGAGLLPLLGVSLLGAAFAASFITYVIPIPGWQMARALLGDGWRSSLRWQVAAFAAFAPIGIVSDIVQGSPETLKRANNVLVVIGGVNLLFNIVLAARGGTREVRVLFAGSAFFMLYALNRNLAALKLVPWGEPDETLGFVVFVACLGYAAVRAFVRGERQRLTLEGELDTAREIQRSILPASTPDLPGLRFDVRYDPASSVAGDLYDFVGADGTRAALLVADVAGHGVPAALIASMVKIAVSSHSRLAHDPAAMLAALNETLRREVRRAFVTATYLCFDTSTRCVAVSNAGHPSPLLLRGGAFRELGGSGVLLGRFGPTRYDAQQAALFAGDRVVAWTDGIVEARNRRGEAFGDERLRAMVQNRASADAVVEAVHRWRDPEAVENADDLTIVIVDVTA